MPKIDYEELEFENAYIYRRCRLPLENQGLVLVRGLNLDDGGYLGSGKTSPFEVFAQVQIGKGGKRESRRGDRRAEMVNTFVGCDFAARLRLRVNGHPYEIQQYREHHRFGNQVFVFDREKSDNQTIVPRDVRRAHKWIREGLLSIDETTFFNLIYLVQELNNVMIHGTEGKRRGRLTEMFDLDIYDDLQKEVKRTLSLRDQAMIDLDEVRSELTDVVEKLGELPELSILEEELIQNQQSLEKLQEAHEEDTEQFKQASDLLAKLRRREEHKNQAKKRFRKSTALRQAVNKPPEITQEKLSEWKAEYDNAQAELTNATNTVALLEKRVLLENQLRKLTGRSVEEIQDELAEIKTQLTQLTKIELPQAEERQEALGELANKKEPAQSVSVLEEEEREVKDRRQEITSSIRAIKLQLEDAVCPTCHRPFDMSSEEINVLQTKLGERRKQLEEVTGSLNRLKSRLQAARAFKKVKRRLAAIGTERTPEEVMKDIRRLTSLEKKLTAEFETSKRRLAIQAELDTLPEGTKLALEEDCARLRRESERLWERYDDGAFIYNRLQEIQKLPKEGKPDELVQEVNRRQQRLRRLVSVISDMSTEVAHLEQQVTESRQLARRRRVLTSTLEQRESLLQEVKCLRALLRAFGPSGLKQDRFSSILTDAAERTVPTYSSVLWPKRNVEIQLEETDSSLQLELTRTAEGVTTNSSLLSGGERHKSGLAFLFGMRDLKELYTGSTANVLIVDEPFGNLDPLGTEGLISVFMMLRKKFNSIFVISHRPEVLSHPIWDQTWWAVRQNNEATLYFDSLPAKYQQVADGLVKQ